MFYFGVDYYPEHWPEGRWAEDARLMAEAGINVVRLAEFAWSCLEPGPDHFDFDWLDRALEVLHSRGIYAVLGTPTASAPPWVMAMMPDAFRVLETGQRQTYGHRRGYCPSHPGYRERGNSVTQAMAEHYADHPAVIGWQIDNELGGRCFCSTCRARFQTWLQEKYGGLDRLNSAWGSVFWSQVYTDWSHIPVPLETGGVPNPGLDLDYRRFMSDAYVCFQEGQVEVLRRTCPNHFITHNLMGFRFDEIDYFDLAQALDFVAWDNYLRTGWSLDKDADVVASALAHDTMRGLKGRSFWLMEQQAGCGGWQTTGLNPRPGEMRLWTYQAIAHGADAIVYFRWRTARFGAEQYWHGMLDHDGQPRRRYRELQVIGAELKRVGEQILEAESRPQVAMLLCYDSRFAFQAQPNHPDFKYSELFAGFYRALHRRNVGVDIVAPGADLSRYRLVLAPALHVLGQEVADSLRRYVEKGGTLLTTARAGVKDETNAVVDMPLPGLLADVCGVEVDEYEALPVDVKVPIGLALPGAGPKTQTAHARLWCDVLTPTTAQTIGRYRAGTGKAGTGKPCPYYADRAAITLNPFGQGQAMYVGTLGDEALQDAIVGWLVDATCVSPALTTPQDVEAVERSKNGRRLLFLLNHGHEGREVALPEAMRDLLTGQPVERKVTLEAKAAMILDET